MSSILILIPGIDYDINHGELFIIITFEIKYVIPSILLYRMKGIFRKWPYKADLGHISETLLWEVFQQILWEHTNALTESVPTSLVGMTFLQGLLLKVSHKPSRTGLQ